MKCPSCRRPVAVARPRCLYCGSALPAELVATPAPTETPGALPDRAPAFRPAEIPSATAAERMLLILDLTSADREALARALGTSAFETDQRLRRGGFELLRIGEAHAITEEATRFAADGLRVGTVPEREARVRPEVVLGGAREAHALKLKTEEGPLAVEAGDVFFVVRGPIAREYQPLPKRQRISIAGPESGYRIHLHRRSNLRPVELNPGAFEFGQSVLASSSLLELTSWLEELLPGVPSDDNFRRMPPALAPSSPETGVVSAARALARPASGGRLRRGEVRRMLDNLEQFRFYSAWRAAFERRSAA